jgi:hypothetical protein
MLWYSWNLVPVLHRCLSVSRFTCKCILASQLSWVNGCRRVQSECLNGCIIANKFLAFWPFSQARPPSYEKTTISCVVCPSIRMEHLAPHWTDAHKIWYFSVFRTSVEKIQILLKCDMTGTLHEVLWPFMINLAEFFVEWEIFQTKIVVKMNTLLSYTITFF